ncbi:outer membrane protein [Arenimonas caeni]|nr:outer membrane beta-barrel protein [Arenimonas caeni]
MKLRTSLLAALCLAAPAAMAADGDWTGWYAGLHAGHGSGNSDARVGVDGQWAIETPALRDEVADTWSTDLDPSGAAYGLQFGYQHQFAGGFVLGAEIDWSKLDLDDSRSTGMQPTVAFPALAYDFGNAIELDDKLALKGRFGYASGRHLFFASVGWVQVDATALAAVESNGGYLKLGRHSETLEGTEWGVGYEFDFGNQWSLRGEYLVTDLDTMRYDTAYLPGSTFTSPAYLETVRQDADFDTFRIALNYRF